MAETTVEKSTCEKCGAEVRENTLFCYACGGRVADEEPISQPGEATNGSAAADVHMSDETRAALDDLSERFKIEEPSEEELLAHAAAERKRSRVRPRKKKDVVWETSEDGSYTLFVLATLLICVITAAIVFLMVYWK
jgi:hypothetical protein